MTVHETLVDARNLIDRQGWQTGSMHSAQGYCLAGAIRAAEGLVPHFEGEETDLEYDQYEFKSLAMQTVLEVLGEKDGVWVWNDHVCRGKQHALGVLDRAIALTAPPPAFESLTAETPAAEAGLNQRLVV